MTWLKRNFVPLIMGLIFLAMIVLSLLMLKEVRAQQIDAENRQRELKDQLDKQMGLAIFPSPNNMLILQNQTKQLEVTFHDVYEALPKQTREYPAMQPWEFKGYLETELLKLESYCRAKEVLVPSGMSFGFGRYVGSGAPPKREDTSALMHQLDLAEQLVRLLVQSKVVELNSLRRTYLDGETEAGRDERVEGGVWKKDPHLLYESQNFEVTFRCNNDTLKTTLANLATATNLLVLVRNISVDVPRVFPPTPVDSGTTGTPGAPTLSPATPQGRTVAPAHGIPNRPMPPGVPPPVGGRVAPSGRGAQTTQPDQSGSKAPAEVPLALGSELATVTLRLDVLEIKTEEAKEDGKPVAKEPAKDAKKELGEATMEFLKNHWEKLVLAIALLGLMASAVLVGLRIGQGQLQTTIPNPPKRQPPPLDMDALGALVDHAKHPPVWKGGPPPLFISVNRWWERKNAKWTLVTGDAPPVPEGNQCEGIPRQWFKDNGLDYKEQDICEKDSDNDGWSNQEEYRFKTKPNDANSHPEVKDYLFLHEIVRNEFKLLFLGTVRSSDGRITFQINVRDLSFTYMNTIGEQVSSGERKENYRVESYEPKSKDVFDASLNVTRPVDVSELTLSRMDDGSKIVLVLGKATKETTLGAKLLNKLNDRVFQVAKEEEFKIRGETYKVIDIKNDGVIISDSLKREFKITAPKTGE